MTKQRVIAFDIDGVLCEETNKPDDYADRRPVQLGIACVKYAKRQGAKVILYTARYPEDEEVTRRWLRKHKVPFDELFLGKPKADAYVDDRAFRWPVTNMAEVANG